METTYWGAHIILTALSKPNWELDSLTLNFTPSFVGGEQGCVCVCFRGWEVFKLWIILFYALRSM